jgi:hypothetical protein
VCNKGENTSAIYRLKVSEKYAFVQTHSKLVPYILGENEEAFDLPENEKEKTLTLKKQDKTLTRDYKKMEELKKKLHTDDDSEFFSFFFNNEQSNKI